MADVTIRTPQDWETNRVEKRLTSVVDPLIFRVADVFLRGRSAQEADVDAERVWGAIRENTDTLCAFFDTLMLEEDVPMYDYYVTFPPDLYNGRQVLLEWCNASDSVLVDVSVEEDAYASVKEAALATLRALPPVDVKLAEQIVSDMSIFDWEWRPDISLTERNTDFAPQTNAADKAPALETFRYAVLLFGGYAQLLGADHVLHPKRSEAIAALVVDRFSKVSAAKRQEAGERWLFEELMNVVRKQHDASLEASLLPEHPTFLPLLLRGDVSTPRDVLKRALRLRKSGAAKEYRHWWREVRHEFGSGIRSAGRKKTVRTVAAALLREFEADPSDASAVTAKIQAEVGLEGPKLAVSAEKEFSLASTVGWLLNGLPGRRYRKLLARMIRAQAEQSYVDERLLTLWKSS